MVGGSLFYAIFAIDNNAMGDFIEYVKALVPLHAPNCPRIDDRHMFMLFLGSLMLGIVVTCVVLYIIPKEVKKGKNYSQLTNINLVGAFALIWLFGFIVYDVGMYTGERWSLLFNAPMAVIHAFGMFVLASDISAVHEPFHNNWIFMACYSLAHFLAAFVSLLFVIKHFGFNIYSGARLIWASYRGKPRQNTYVLWGMSDVTYYLAKSIVKHHEKDADYRIVFVRTNHDNEEKIVRNGMERLFDFLSLKDRDIDRLQELDCLTTNTFSNLSKIAVEENADTDVLGGMGLKALKRIITKKSKGTVHLFFLTGDDITNIKAVANLRRDTSICQMARDGQCKLIFYCKARYNSVHRVIEDEQFHDNIEVKVVDTSHICIELLKKNPALHPVNYVDVEHDATVSSLFHSLVVGFGEVGMDAVRFLYEFGAFVKSGSTSDDVCRSDFHCDVVDKDMENISGAFVANAPAIRPAMPFVEGCGNPEALITLHDMDCRSAAFYQKLETWIRTLNYVVVATNNDELNISLAVRIFRLAVRYREHMEHFRILVRVYRDEDHHIGRIAEHYNRLWAAEAQSIDKGKNTHQKTVGNTEHLQVPITLFGTDETTYSYEYVISDGFERLAKRYKHFYDSSVNALKKQSGYQTEESVTWDNEYRDLMQLTDEYKGFSPTYSGLMRLRRIQTQNKANCLHIPTKRMLALRALGKEDYEVLSDHQLFRKDGETTYSWKEGAVPKEGVLRVLEVLAQTEHLRWNASHEVLGYVDEGTETDKDEARLKHGCLKKWQQLSLYYKSFDYNVVDVSLNVIDQEKPQA